MVNQLEAGVLKVGMTKDEVIALLGPSEITSENEKTFNYCLGFSIIDYEHFRVVFGDNGLLESFIQIQG